METNETGEQRPFEIGQGDEWSITTDSVRLKQDPELATLILRLGAAVNTIRAVQRWSQSLKDATGTVAERDRIWSFLVSTAYLKEAIDSVLRENCTEIVRLARDDRTPEEHIENLGQLMSKKPQTHYSQLLVTARNSLVFHWETETFRRWVEKHDATEFEWVSSRVSCGPKVSKVPPKTLPQVLNSA